MIQPPSNVAMLRAAWRAGEGITAASQPCFSIDNRAPVPKLYVNGIIGGFEADASEFIKAVHSIDAQSIDMHINSPGGFVFDAVSMYEALVQSSAKVAMHIDGLAASAASFLAQAGDSVVISSAGRMMIHDAQGIGLGGPADLREYADLLDAVSNDIAGIYAARAGGEPAAWRAAMTATTWYSAEQAVGASLADRVAASKSGGPDNRTRLIQARNRALATQGG